MSYDNFNITTAGTNFWPMYEFSVQAGWNQTVNDLQQLTIRFPQFSLLAVSGKKGENNVLGSGLVISAEDPLWWIGMILVHAAHRRRGIATALINRCLELARSEMNSSVIGLDATPAGLQVYQRTGFKSSFRIWRSVVPTGTQTASHNEIERLSTGSLNDHADFLKRVYPEGKLAGLELIRQLNPSGGWLARSAGKTVGLVLSRPGRLKPFVGPLLAESIDTGKYLLDHVLSYWQQAGHSEVFMDIPETHFRSASLWEKDTCRTKPVDYILNDVTSPSRCLIRMYELVADPEFELTEKKSTTGSHPRSIETLKQAHDAFQKTLDYMEEEQRLLQYLYATGGPELG